MLFAILIFCGLLIGVAIFLLVRSVRNIAKGRCCEGCDGCPVADACSSGPESARRSEPKS